MRLLLTKRTPLLVLAVLATSLLCAAHSRATLHDRGGGLIYDDVLDITWLQDVQYVQTSGSSASPTLDYPAAVAWVSTLQYEDPVRGTIWDDWRLPTTTNEPGSLGYDTTGESSELAYMYYVNLGYAANESGNPDDPIPTSNNYNPFINLAYLGYWSGTLWNDPAPGDPLFAWYFHFHFGWQYYTSAENNGDVGYVWAVRDGDVCEPIPNGDINDDCQIDLHDVILALQIVSGIPVSAALSPASSISGTGAIGLADAIHALDYLANAPPP